MRQIREELGKNPDELQNAILVGYIELALNFCQRFYNRQFVTRKIENSDILVRFDRLLRDYFEDKLQLTLGLPTVQYCADKLCMSPNYFGDVIKKTTGDTASNHIRQFIIQLAKNGLAAGNRLPSVRPPRLRISPALQPDVQEAGGGYAVGVLPKDADVTKSPHEPQSAGANPIPYIISVSYSEAGASSSFFALFVARVFSTVFCRSIIAFTWSMKSS